MYTAFLDNEISHQSPGRHLRWHWMHPLRCLCCSWCCAAELVLLCTKLRSCSSRQHSHTTQHNWRICRPKQNLHLELLGKLLWSEEFSQAWSFDVTSKLFLTMMERIVYGYLWAIPTWEKWKIFRIGSNFQEIFIYMWEGGKSSFYVIFNVLGLSRASILDQGSDLVWKWDFCRN